MQKNAQVKPQETADNGDIPAQGIFRGLFLVIVLADIWTNQLKFILRFCSQSSKSSEIPSDSVDRAVEDQGLSPIPN